MVIPLLISVNLLSNIILVAIYVHSKKKKIIIKKKKNLLSEIRVKSKTFGDRAFKKMAPKLWNNLPKRLDPSQTLINLNPC